MEWFESGSAELSKVDLLVENQRLELQNAVLDFSPEEFRLSQFRLLDDHGRIAGSGIFRRQATGQNELNLRIAGVDIGPYATMLLPLEFATLQGNVALEVRLKKAASSSNFLHDWNGQIKGSLLNLRLRGVRIGELSGEAQLTENLLQTKLTGNILAGQAELNGTLPMTMLQWEGTPQPESSDQGFQFDAKLANVDLSRLISIASDARAGASYSGMASIKSRGVVRGPSEFSVDANINIPLFKHQRKEIAKELEANLSLEDGKLQILDMVGGVAGGRIQAQGSLNLHSIRSNAGELFFDAQRIQIDDLIGLVFPEYAHAFGGKVSYRGTVRLKDQFIVTGDARATKAHWYDLPIQNAHGDLRLAIDRNGALAGLSSRNVNGTAAGGNLLGSIDFRGGRRASVQTNGRIVNGKLEQLSRALGFDHVFGSGRFDANFDMGSRDAFSLSALTGQVQLKFEDSDVQSVPLLPELRRLVPVLAVSSTSIKNGSMRARIGQGEVQIQDMLLNSDAFWILANGQASLISGQLDIDALLQTGRGIDQEFSQKAIQQLVVDFLPQAIILAELNDLLRNRTLYFTIDGTAKRPLIRPRAAQTIARSLLQNFRRQLLVIPAFATDSRPLIDD